MDDWTFMPKRLFRLLAIVVVSLAILVGVVTGDTQKGVEFYLKEVELISKPIQNRLLRAFNRIPIPVDSASSQTP